MPSKCFFVLKFSHKADGCLVILLTPRGVGNTLLVLTFVYHVLKLVNMCMLFIMSVCLFLTALNSAR